MIGAVVEVFLCNGRSFLGLTVEKDLSGITVRGADTRYIEEQVVFARGRGLSVRETLMLQTAFFPYARIDYVNVHTPLTSLEEAYGQWFAPDGVVGFFADGEL